MSHFYNVDPTFKGRVFMEEGAAIKGGLRVDAGGQRLGDYYNNWPVTPMVNVENSTERGNVALWRNSYDPITPLNPLVVWRRGAGPSGAAEITYDGTEWFNLTPRAGDMRMTMRTTPANGWVFMQGQTLTNAKNLYPNLYAAVPSNMKSGDDLIVPDMRGRVPIGAGQASGLTNRTLGTNVGYEKITLGVTHMPAHTHTGSTGAASSTSHDHGYRLSLKMIAYSETGGGSSWDGLMDFATGTRASGTGAGSGTTGSSSVPHTHSFTTGSAGSGTAFEIVQSSFVVNFEMKL